MSETADHVRVGDRLATLGRVTRVDYYGHWALLTVNGGGHFLANGGIVNLDRHSAIHLRHA